MYTYFFHPEDDNLKFHVFADVPHLLKLARNHFLDHGFAINGVKVDRACLQKLLAASKSELKIAFKINRYHLDTGCPKKKDDSIAPLFIGGF
jgi:hypothetical protein